jgi:MYXO-CTERM domain-containing protein
MSALVAPATAQVSQLDGTALPTPTGAAETNVVVSRGFPASAVTLDGLFKARGEALDPIMSASTAPGLFSPTCGFSGELLLRGGSCKVAFGWYNADDPANIFELVPADTSLAFMCTDNDFCPLATMDSTQVGQHTWTPKAFYAEDIKNDEKYTGGQIGFALIGDEATQCKQTKYSDLSRNTHSTMYGKPWITTLVYQSTANPEGFYLAFEDLKMSPESWTNAGPGSPSNDGDFNDFVYFINGLSCTGGGLPCEVAGAFGACSVGRTDCATEGTTGMCRPIITAGAELCDNVDNDCNGVVDDGVGLCPGTQVCDKGSCVEACGTGEFRCGTGFSCVAGQCIDDVCATVECPAGQACRNGTCLNACDGVVCPAGEECQLGRCVDPCKAVACTGGKVCERGLCVSDCNCRGCAEGLKCGLDGRCSDPRCVGIECPAGEKCAAGACVDACAGVMCPGGADCVNGACQMPSGGSSNGGGTDGGIILGGALNLGGKGSTNGTGNDSNGPGLVSADPGCACEVVGSSRSGTALFLAGLATALALGRRRRNAA